MINRPIFLIGFMGAGKTTFGKKLANKLGVEYLDADRSIENSQGIPIDEIFEQHGELFFRKKEQEWLTSFNPNRLIVCGTGGGMPCFFENIRLMKEKGVVVYLKHPPKQLVNRLVNAKSVRPIVKNKNKEELEELVFAMLTDREMFYNQADIILEPSNQDVAFLIEQIKELSLD